MARSRKNEESYDELRAKIPASTMALSAMAAVVVKSWGWTETFLGDETHDEGWLEALLHELSHAARLGILPTPLTKELPDAVSFALDSRDEASRLIEEADTLAIEEADTLATEFLSWDLLGLPWGFDALCDLALAQGVGEGLLQDSSFGDHGKALSEILDAIYNDLPVAYSAIRGGLS